MKSFDNYNLDNKSTIDRLRLGDWYVLCWTTWQLDLLLQACDNAGLIWYGGHSLTERPKTPPPAYVIYAKDDKALCYYEKNAFGAMFDYENITGWFFHSIQK